MVCSWLLASKGVLSSSAMFVLPAPYESCDLNHDVIIEKGNPLTQFCGHWDSPTSRTGRTWAGVRGEQYGGGGGGVGGTKF